MTRRTATAATNAALSLLTFAGALGAESVQLQFAPPSGQTYELRSLETTEQRVGGNRSTHRVATLESVRVRREGGSTYLVRRIEQAAHAPEDKPFETPPVAAAMIGAEVVQVLGFDGALARVDGYREITARVLPKLEGKAREGFAKFMAEGRQEMRDAASWYELEMLSGQRLDLDRDYWFESAWPDEKGWVRYQTLVRLGPWVDRPEGRRLSVNLAYVADARAVIPDAVRLFPRVKSRLDPEKPGGLAPGLRFEGTAQWLLDPATLVVWRAQGTRKTSEPLPLNDDLELTAVTQESFDRVLTAAAPSARSN